MSDQDNLRDRIAEIVNTALVEWNTDMDTQDSEGEYAAQEIIDELGLTVETHVDLGALPDHLQGVWMDDPAFREWEAKQPRKTRIVGKWEEQCHP